MYGAASVEYSEEASAALERYETQGFGGLPICMAKTQVGGGWGGVVWAAVGGGGRRGQRSPWPLPYRTVTATGERCPCAASSHTSHAEAALPPSSSLRLLRRLGPA